VNSFQPRDLNSQNKEKQKGRRQIKKILSAARLCVVFGGGGKYETKIF
jgi:hypothetical protein